MRQRLGVAAGLLDDVGNLGATHALVDPAHHVAQDALHVVVEFLLALYLAAAVIIQATLKHRLTAAFTAYQTQYFAWLLSRRIGGESADMLAATLVDAQVDLNPHQVEAALFAFKSPLSKGVILADEVGLGKTIEAGLVIAQRWAERKRRILVVVPANLRKQWHQELQDKFSLQGLILEARNYRQLRKNGAGKPFVQADRVVICSYQFAKSKADDLKAVPWDLVVMDEAHRLRNVYKRGNVIGKTLKEALVNAPKVLLTATPLQNSLLELYGLVSVVDERVFGDLENFRDLLHQTLPDRSGLHAVFRRANAAWHGGRLPASPKPERAAFRTAPAHFARAVEAVGVVQLRHRRRAGHHGHPA